jgi:hypothetical protein
MSKKHVIFLFSILISSSIFSQNTLDSLIKYKSKDIKMVESQDHFMINFTMDNVIAKSSDTGFSSNWFNPNIGFYFLYDMPLGKSGLSFAPGIGFTFSKVNLDKSILSQDSSGTYFQNSNSHPLITNTNTAGYDGSSFYNSWIEAPIELRYKTKPLNGRSRIKIAVGMRFGIRLASNSKINYYDKYLGEQTVVQSSFSGINGIRYGATFRIGYGAINLFGYYGMSQLMKDSQNPRGQDLRQYSIGVSLTGM